MARILVIEDDSPVQALFKELLEGEGYSVSLADNGREGLFQIYEQKPDLIITDIMMPEMDGIEVIQAIHKLDKNLPIIAISGGMRDLPINFLTHAKKLGAFRVFEKPVVLSEILCAIRELLLSSPD
ncbi:MAG: response regulator [Pontiellaceae bacterium]|jgi:CheY-like chemotaxis protein|nr:response regulator [Pontiellaceae bacterium]